MDTSQFPKIEARTQDSEAWYARISSDNIPLLSLREIDVQKKGIQLAFPKSHGFLSRLERPEINRLLKHDWSIKKTLYLDHRFLQTHFELRPSEVGSWIIDVEEQGVYYNVLLTTRGYVSGASPIELKDSVLHEMDHLQEYLSKMIGGELPHGIGGTLEVEDSIRKEEHGERLDTFSVLARRYGLLRAYSALAEAERKLAISFFRKPAMMAVVTEHWLGRFCRENWKDLSDVCVRMPESMKKADLKKSWVDVKERSSALYKYFAGVELPE
jgi:hypothetical protein